MILPFLLYIIILTILKVLVNLVLWQLSNRQRFLFLLFDIYKQNHHHNEAILLFFVSLYSILYTTQNSQNLLQLW